MPLRDLIERYDNTKQISTLISQFKCEKNSDVSRFLKQKSIRFEQADKSRTYLIIPEEEVLNDNGTLKIMGYFTLAQKHITLPQEISNSKRQKYDGINKKATNVNCYLIGQLGKNDRYKKQIKGSAILEQSINIIKKCNEYVGGRLILVECKNEKKLIEFYKNNFFEYLANDKQNNLLQFILPLNKMKFTKKDNKQELLKCISQKNNI